MNTNVDKEVAALLANDEDALRDRGRVVFSLVNSVLQGIRSFVDSKPEGEWKTSAQQQIKLLIREVESKFGKLCVILAKKNYYSLEELTVSCDIFDENDLGSDYVNILMQGAEAVRISNHVDANLIQEQSVDSLMRHQAEMCGAVSIINQKLEEAEKLPENKAL